MMQIKEIKISIHRYRVITPKPVASSGAHLRNSALGQQNFEEISQRWQAVGDTVSDLDRSGN